MKTFSLHYMYNPQIHIKKFDKVHTTRIIFCHLREYFEVHRAQTRLNSASGKTNLLSSGSGTSRRGHIYKQLRTSGQFRTLPPLPPSSKGLCLYKINTSQEIIIKLFFMKIAFSFFIPKFYCLPVPLMSHELRD